jgi:hypothetical protein
MLKKKFKKKFQKKVFRNGYNLQTPWSSKKIRKKCRILFYKLLDRVAWGAEGGSSNSVEAVGKTILKILEYYYILEISIKLWRQFSIPS